MRAYAQATGGGPTQQLRQKGGKPVTFATVELPAGRYALFGTVALTGITPTFTGICILSAGPASDVGTAASYGGTAAGTRFVSTSANMMLLAELESPTTAKLGCWTPRSGSWNNARIVAIEVSGTIKVKAPPVAQPPGGGVVGG